MKVVTPVVNNPDFIYLQYYTLKKYFKGDYEFIVFNDAKDFSDFTNYENANMKREIEDKCRELDIKCINIPNDHHKDLDSSSGRCADSMNFILNYQKENPDIYLILDSDMFLIDVFDPHEFKEYDCGIVLQQRDENKYFWHGLCYLDFTKIKKQEDMNWNVSENPRLDTGGMMHIWLGKQLRDTIIPNATDIRYDKYNHCDNTYFFRHLWSCSWNETELPINLKSKDKLVKFLHEDVRNENGKFFCEIYDNRFLHYRAGCNWRQEGRQIHNILTKKLMDAIID